MIVNFILIFLAANLILLNSESSAEIEKDLKLIQSKMQRAQKNNALAEFADLLRGYQKREGEYKQALDEEIENTNFEKIKSSCLRNEFKGGNSLDVLERVRNRLSTLKGNYGVIIYKGERGSNNWGSVRTLVSERHFTEDRDGVVYVVWEGLPLNNDGAYETRWNFSQARELAISNLSGNPHERAKHIYNEMISMGWRPKLVIGKKAPGGFENWAYSMPSTYNYHEWHGEHCYGILF